MSLHAEMKGEKIMKNLVHIDSKTNENDILLDIRFPVLKFRSSKILSGCKTIICRVFSIYVNMIKELISKPEETFSDDSVELVISDDTYEIDEEESEDDNNVVLEEDLPFCQLFNVSSNMCLLIDHVEMCPDETAFIRVVDDEGYTPLYKRKVRRDKKDNRFIVFSGENYYLDDKKTQPSIHARL